MSQTATSFPFHADLALASEDDTRALAKRFAGLLRAGDVLLLEGPIGAGKTAFARALILARLAASGLPPEDVPSPTFTLVQTYDVGDTEIWHADLYRLSHSSEAIELGLEDAFASAICLVEWPDRLGGHVPDTALHLNFEPQSSGEARRLRISGAEAWAGRLRPVLEARDG